MVLSRAFRLCGLRSDQKFWLKHAQLVRPAAVQLGSPRHVREQLTGTRGASRYFASPSRSGHHLRTPRPSICWVLEHQLQPDAIGDCVLRSRTTTVSPTAKEVRGLTTG